MKERLISYFWRLMGATFFGMLIFSIANLSSLENEVKPNTRYIVSKKETPPIEVIHYKGKTLEDYVWEEINKR